jgi:hypothetical protein
MGIVQERRSVNANTNSQASVSNETTPFWRDKRAVGLNGMINPHLIAIQISNDFECFGVECNWKHERLSRMPNNREGSFHHRTLKDPVEYLRQSSWLDPLTRLSERQIAIVAIEIAKRCGLND